MVERRRALDEKPTRRYRLYRVQRNTLLVLLRGSLYLTYEKLKTLQVQDVPKLAQGNPAEPQILALFNEMVAAHGMKNEDLVLQS
jgi:hypothetical protein